MSITESTVPAQEEIAMSVELNKSVARRFIEEVWNQGQLGVADELLAPDLVTHQVTGEAMTGRDAFKRFIGEFRAASPDIRFAVEDMIGEGDKVATRVTIHATQAGQTVAWTGIGIVRLAGGQIAEQWANTDPVGAAQPAGSGPS
jgi:predicted SnoaL-like aldol condensation-catalyzing enzyme